MCASTETKLDEEQAHFNESPLTLKYQVRSTHVLNRTMINTSLYRSPSATISSEHAQAPMVRGKGYTGTTSGMEARATALTPETREGAWENTEQLPTQQKCTA